MTDRSAATARLLRDRGLFVVGGYPVDSNDFWCRAFLAEMNGTCSRTMVNWDHERATERFVKAADVALAVAQRRGMVTGVREASAPQATPDGAKPDRVEAGQRWSIDFRDINGVIEEHMVEAIGDDLARLKGARGVKYVTTREMLTSPRFALIGHDTRDKPKLERVEFSAAPDELKPGWWRVCVHDVGVFVVLPGDDRATRTDGNVVRIKWGESPPKPIEVWLERKGGA